MKWWVFHEEQLSDALEARERKRQEEGATEQQAKDETQIVLQFIAASYSTLGRGD